MRLLAARACSGWRPTKTSSRARCSAGVAADMLYRPYEVGADGKTVRCLFRDHALSDVIGFVYQSWEPAAAADDFVGRVRETARRFGAARQRFADEPVVSVILDGENAWEHYEDGGRPFLRALYQRLEEATDSRRSR